MVLNENIGRKREYYGKLDRARGFQRVSRDMLVTTGIASFLPSSSLESHENTNPDKLATSDDKDDQTYHKGADM